MVNCVQDAINTITMINMEDLPLTAVNGRSSMLIIVIVLMASCTQFTISEMWSRTNPHSWVGYIRTWSKRER